MKPYYYLFFRYYSITKHFESDIPELFAAAQCTMTLFLIAASIFGIIAPDLMHSWMQTKATRVEAIIAMGLFFIPNYFLFIHRNRYRAILKMFKDESKRVEIIGNVLTIILTIVVIWCAVKARNIYGP